MFAKFSPDATRVGYVRANDIYVERIDDGRDHAADERRIGDDDQRHVRLGLRRGARRARRFPLESRTARAIAYWQFDCTGVGIFSLINNTDSLYPAITRIPYPKAGHHQLRGAHRRGRHADGGETRWMKTPGDPRNTYLARLEWVDDDDGGDPAAEPAAEPQRPPARRRRAPGEVQARVSRRVEDAGSTWSNDVPWIDGGRAFLWVSERDGWQHVYRVPREGGDGQLITNVRRPTSSTSPGSTRSGGWLYFIASPQNATQRYLYRARLDGSGAPERVTPRGAAGHARATTLAPGGRWRFTPTRASISRRSTDVVEPAGSPSRCARSPTPSALIAKLAPVLKPPVEFFTIDIGGGVTLDGWMLKPPDFDPRAAIR